MRKEPLILYRRHFMFAAKSTGMVPSAMSSQSLLLEFTQQQSMVAGCWFNLCCSMRTKHWHLRLHFGKMYLSSVIIEPFHSITILCGRESQSVSRIRCVRIFPRKVLPGSSGDEHVGFFCRIDRLLYGLQKNRSPRPTALSGDLYGSSVSSA